MKKILCNLLELMLAFAVPAMATVTESNAGATEATQSDFVAGLHVTDTSPVVSVGVQTGAVAVDTWTVDYVLAAVER